MRNDPSLARNVGTLEQEAAAGGAAGPSGVFNEGDVLMLKIANVQRAEPSDAAKVVATLARADELVAIGPVQGRVRQPRASRVTRWWARADALEPG